MIRSDHAAAGDSQPTVLVTGSGGRVGRWLVACLAAEGRWRVVATDRDKPTLLPDGVAFVACDLTVERSLALAMDELRRLAGRRLASVVHLAAHADFSGEPSDAYEQVNVQGTRRLFEHLQPFDVEQFIFISTMLVHRPCQPGERIDEGWPLDPKWAYPQSKMRAEQWLRDHHGATPLVMLRLAGVYDDVGRSLPLAHQIQRIYERRRTSQVFPGNIHHGQAMVHADDVCDAVARAIDQRAELPKQSVLLIGEPDTLSYDQVQRNISHHLHHEMWETHEIPKSLARAGAWVRGRMPVGEEPFIKPWMIDRADEHYALDVTRAMSWLNWRPRHRLHATLPRIIAALKNDPVAWYREHQLEMPGWLEESARVRSRS